MNNDFLASLDKLIGGEAARVAAQKAEQDRLDEEGRHEADRIAALDPQIRAKLGEVTTTWNGCLEAIQHKSREIGFLADISGWYDKATGSHNLQVNFHLHSHGAAQPLKLTVMPNGMGRFEPNRATSFDFLQAGPGVFEGNLLDHVTDLFHQIRNGR